MTGRTHDMAAITALGYIVLIIPPFEASLATVLVAVMANLVGGIAPDIDQPTAPFWRNLPIGGFFGRAFDQLLGGHRFLTHSLLGMALFGFAMRALLHFLQPIMHGVDGHLVWWAFMIGMLSHLIMDSFTKEGVPWLLPIPVRFGLPPLRRLRITTGRFIEAGLIFPGLVLLDGYLSYKHYHQILFMLRHHIS